MEVIWVIQKNSTPTMDLILALWRTVESFHKKLKIELPYNLAIPLLDMYPKE
jgi:hypothetical protein